MIQSIKYINFWKCYLFAEKFIKLFYEILLINILFSSILSFFNLHVQYTPVGLTLSNNYEIVLGRFVVSLGEFTEAFILIWAVDV
jgi:hypothetical protein